MKKCYVEWSPLYVYSMNPSLYRSGKGMDEVIFKEKTTAATALCPCIINLFAAGIRVQWFPTPIAPQFFVANKMEVHMPAFLYDLFQQWLYPEAKK